MGAILVQSELDFTVEIHTSKSTLLTNGIFPTQTVGKRLKNLTSQVFIPQIIGLHRALFQSFYPRALIS